MTGVTLTAAEHSPLLTYACCLLSFSYSHVSLYLSRLNIIPAVRRLLRSLKFNTANLSGKI